MTRSALALAALWLLACSPVGRGDAADDAPAKNEAPRSAPASPASGRRREHPARPAAKTTARAETGGAYQYVDESGRVQFAARLEDVPERQRSTAASIAAAPAAPTRSARTTATDGEEPGRTTRAQVVVYTTRTCPYCRAAMAYMDRIGQDYENRDVEADEDAQSEYLELTHGERGVPVIVVGRDWMQGWSQTQFDRLIAKAQ
jgi:glutaredoxin 3